MNIRANSGRHMLVKWGVFVCVALLCSLLSAQPAPPGGGSTDPKELARRAGAMMKLVVDVDAVPTPQQQADGVAACAAFQAAYPHRTALDAGAKRGLGKLGLRAGWTAGDPDVMLHGAQLMMEAGDNASNVAYAVAWGGLYAGDAAAAKAGFDALMSSPVGENGKRLAEWAKTMLPQAAAAGKAVNLKFQQGGQTIDIANLRGKVVVLHFWGDEDPSPKDAQALQAFYDARRQDRSFVMYGLGLAKGGDPAQAGKARGFTWPQAPGAGLRDRFAGSLTPHLVVISPRGHVMWQGSIAGVPTLARTADFARRHAASLAKPPASATQPTQPARQR